MLSNHEEEHKSVAFFVNDFTNPTQSDHSHNETDLILHNPTTSDDAAHERVPYDS